MKYTQITSYVAFIVALFTIIFANPTWAKPTSQDVSLYVIEWSPNGEMIAKGLSDGTVQIVDIMTNTIISEFKVNDSGISVIAWSPSNDKIITGGVYDSSVEIWDISSPQLIATIPDSNGTQIFDLAWSPDGRYIFVARRAGENNISVWDSASLEFVYGEQVITITDIEWSPDNQHIALSHFAPHISIWDAQTFEETAFLGDTLEVIHEQRNTGLNYGIFNIEWSPDGEYIVAGTIQGFVKVWTVNNNEIIYDYQAHGDIENDPQAFVREVWFDPSGRVFSSIAADGTVRTWSLQTGNLLGEYQLTAPIITASINSTHIQFVYSGENQSVEFEPRTSITVDDIQQYSINCGVSTDTLETLDVEQINVFTSALKNNEDTLSSDCMSDLLDMTSIFAEKE